MSLGGIFPIAMAAAAGPALRDLTGGSPNSGQVLAVISALGQTQVVWTGALIMVRLGAVAMLLPGLGEATVPPTVRLSFTFLFALMLMPVIGPHIPAMPEDLAGVVLGIFHELVVGLMLGTLIKVFISALAVAGEIVSLQTNLSFAQTADPTQAQNSTAVGTFLGLLGLVLLYAMNLHHLFLRAMLDSYSLFPVSRTIMIGDATQLMIRTVGQAFSLALQMSAPVIVFALIFNLATGFVGRIMPQFPVFFAATPLNLILGFGVFAISLGLSGLTFIGHYQAFLSIFIRPMSPVQGG